MCTGTYIAVCIFDVSFFRFVTMILLFACKGQLDTRLSISMFAQHSIALSASILCGYASSAISV